MNFYFEKIHKKDVNLILIVLGVFTVGLLTGITYSGLSNNEIETTEINVEANSSESIRTVEFYNESIQILVEDGLNSTFYLDKDMDGSADETLEIERDGDIHQSTQFLDYRNSIYRLYYRYSYSPEKENDGWIEFYRVEKLK